jgi:manganese/iron transport system permease protein
MVAHGRCAEFAIGAFASGLLAAGAMAFVKVKTPVREDAVIGIVFTAFFALGLVLISIFPARVDMKNIVLGNILGIAPDDVLQLAIISIVCLTLIALKWRDLMLFCFDANHARALGLPVMWLHVLLLMLLSATAVAALQAVGACLVVAMLVIPGATAYLLTDRFGWLLIIGAVFGTLTGFIGAYASYFIDGQTGGCIVTLQAVLFVIALIFAPKHGLIATRRARA